jgi:hypothetical protein
MKISVVLTVSRVYQGNELHFLNCSAVFKADKTTDDRLIEPSAFIRSSDSLSTPKLSYLAQSPLIISNQIH